MYLKDVTYVVSKLKAVRATNSPVVLCGCETWSHTLREEHSLRVFENSVLFLLRKKEVTGGLQKCMTNFMICIAHRILFG